MEIIVGFALLYVITACVIKVLSLITGIKPEDVERQPYDPNEWYGGGPDPMGGF